MPVTKTSTAATNVTIADVPSIPPTSARPRTLNDRPSEAAMTTRLGVGRDPFQSARARATTASPMSTGSRAIASAAAGDDDTDPPRGEGADEDDEARADRQQDGVGRGVTGGLGRPEGRDEPGDQREDDDQEIVIQQVPWAARPSGHRSGRRDAAPTLGDEQQAGAGEDRGATDLEDQRGVGVARVGEVRRRRVVRPDGPCGVSPLWLEVTTVLGGGASGG